MGEIDLDIMELQLKQITGLIEIEIYEAIAKLVIQNMIDQTTQKIKKIKEKQALLQ